MPVFYIERKSNANASLFLEQLGDMRRYLVPDDSGGTAYDLAGRLNDDWQGETALILQLCLTCRGFPRYQDCWGLEVLKEIRATGHFGGKPNRLQMLPVALLSPLSLEKVLTLNPGNLMALSPGTKFIDFPEGLSKLDLAKLEKDTLSNLADLAPYFRVDFTPPEDRHGYSNFYAACQSLRFYCALFPCSQTQVLLGDIMRVRSRAVRAAQFLYGSEAFSEKDLQTAKTKLEALRRKLWRWTGTRQPAPKKFGLIDDQAEHVHLQEGVGWAEIYGRLLFDREDGLTIIPTSEDTATIARHIDDSYDAILLDLHLEQGDAEMDASNTKGAKVLKAIRQRFPMLPVILTTASRNPDKRKALGNLGCDGYWLKEGVDERLCPAKSIERQLALVELLGNATSPEYALLNHCQRLLARTCSRKLWWQRRGHCWKSGSSDETIDICVDKRLVEERLKRGLLLTRSYLQNKIMGEGFRRTGDEQAWFTGVVVPLGGILEMFHTVDRGASISNEMRQRGDYIGFNLYRLRNHAAHYHPDEPLYFHLLEQFLKGLFCYLLVEPDEFLFRRRFGKRPPRLETLISRHSEYRNFYKENFPVEIHPKTE